MKSKNAAAYLRGVFDSNEKGAALVSVLLLSLLLLVVSGTVILVTGLSRSTTIDAVSERQAADAAAAGMQIVLNTLRGNGSGVDISFKAAAVRHLSNKPDDWMPEPRLSNWLNYTFPAAQPDRIPLTTPYDPYSGLAYSVTIAAPDKATPGTVSTPHPEWVDGPVVKPTPAVKPPKPAWHPWNCAHCSWDYTHCSLYNPPNNGTTRADGFGCRHKHCIPPANWGEASGEDGYQRLIVRVVGYGPRGARKELEALVRRTTFDYNPEALFYIQGADSGSALNMPLSGTPEVKFDSQEQIAFILSNPSDQSVINSAVAAVDKITIVGKGDDYEVLDEVNERPKFLASADEARQLVSELEAEAKVRGRWFTGYPPSGSTGTDSNPMLTFVRGDALINNPGSGVLVVTGTLTIKNTYKGIVMVMGGGRLELNAGGSTGKVEGSIIFAKFGSTGGFLPVEIPTSGGKYEFKSDRVRARNVLETLDVRILAVRNR